MIRNVFLDCETCGLHSVPVLLQYAFDNDPVICTDLWLTPIDQIIELILEIYSNNIIGFNLVFDCFHLVKFFTMLVRLIQVHPEMAQDHPIDCIKELVEVEEGAGRIGCLRPPAACDVMLVAKLGPYQSLSERKNINIRRIPVILAERLQVHLEKVVHIDDIYFSRQKTHKDAPKWTITPSKEKNGKIIRGFMDLTLRFKASGALKVLAQHALKIPASQIIQRSTVLPPGPEIDLGYKPFGGDWPKHVKAHAYWWQTNIRARQYATDDVHYTRELWKHFKSPIPGDVDSDLAVMVASVRWAGMAVNVKGMRRLIDIIKPELADIPQAPNNVKRWLSPLMDPELLMTFTDTKKQTLQGLAKLECDCVLSGHEPGSCELCNGSGLHPVAERAQKVLNARAQKKELEMLEKIVKARRLYPSFRVIGTLSGRMSGADKLNPQGIKRTDDIRALFTMADENEILVSGDFDAFEVVLAIADSGDKLLEADVKKGLKIHALFACEMFQGVTYDQVRASAGTSHDMYTLGKNGVFTMIYGGNEFTLINKYGVAEEQAVAAFKGFDRKYPDLATWRRTTQEQFQVISQAHLGSKIDIHEAHEFVDSMFGYKRYFTLELQIIKALVNLSEQLPEEWKDIKIKVLRRADKGLQTVGNATRSALYGAAFGVQGAIQRAASNHRIQAAGAKITKVVQVRIWRKFQPIGFASWHVRPMNIHDELVVAAKPELEEAIKTEVAAGVESFREKVPLIKMEFERAESWSKGIKQSQAQHVLDSSLDDETIAATVKVPVIKVRQIRKRETWRWLETGQKSIT